MIPTGAYGSFSSSDDDDQYLKSLNSPTVQPYAQFPYYQQHSSMFMYGHSTNNVESSLHFGSYDERPAMNHLNSKRVDPNIQVTLENSDLWKRFSELNLEMIITKNGRYEQFSV